ncbi:MAG TPA: hypothetical protein VKB38_10655 [Terracidiphilus sp.]|nr:hypothetical protein [Terracidiphilus sp.]
MKSNCGNLLRLLRYLPCFLPVVFAVAASGQEHELNFATPVVTTNSTAMVAGDWFIDRYAPCGFVSPETAPDGTQNTLEESICASDLQSNSFFNTQGRGYLTSANTYSVEADLFVPSAWATENARVAGLWAVASDTNDTVTDFPIIEFQGPITSQPANGPSFFSNGGVAGFYGWNVKTNTWKFLGFPSNFQYNHWVHLTITSVPGGKFHYTVKNRDTDEAMNDDENDDFHPNMLKISEVILEGYNYGSAYNIFWNNVAWSTLGNDYTCNPPSGGITPP